MKKRHPVLLLVLLSLFLGASALPLHAVRTKAYGVSTKKTNANTDKTELSNAVSTAEKALSTYKTSIQDGDYYAGTDSKHGIKSHYFVDGTERTSQKGFECSQDQIDALKQAVNDAKELLNDNNATASELSKALDNIKKAKAVCDKKWAPLKDGIYFVINGFADDAPTAAQALKYGENGNILYKRPLVMSEPKQMFEVKVTGWTVDTDGDSIPASATIKNIASDKYLGGISNGKNVFSDTPVTITWSEANSQGSTKQGHRFQLETPTGEKFNGQNNSAGCEITTTGGYQWHRSWMFRPADKYYAEYLANKTYNDFKNEVLAALAVPTAKEDGDLGSNSWIDGTERTAVAGVETTQERLDTLQSAWDKYDADRTAENKTAVEQAMAQVNRRWEPLTSGVYFIIPRLGDDQGNNNTQAMTSQGDAAWKLPLVMHNPAFMFEVAIKSTTKDATLGDVPNTITIKNIATGKYLGKINGSSWEYQDAEAEWSYTTFKGTEFFSDTKHAHCYGLNINGKFMTYANNKAGSALTTTTGGNAWYRAWMFRPADKYYQQYLTDKEVYDLVNAARTSANSAVTPANHHDNTGNRSFLLGNEKTSVDGLATSKEAVENLNNACDIVENALKSGKHKADLTNEIQTMQKAKDVVDAKSNPLTNGYYYLIAEYGDDTGNIPGGYAIQYGKDNANPTHAYKQPYKAEDPKQIFYVEYDEEGHKVYLKNVESGMYLGKTNSNNRWEFVSEKTALYVTSGDKFYWYWGAEKTVAARSCSFVLYNENKTGIMSNTSTKQLTGNAGTSTATQAWTVSWAFRPVENIDIPAVSIENNVATVTCGGDMKSLNYALAKSVIMNTGVTTVDLQSTNISSLTPDEIKISEISSNTIYMMPESYATDAPNFIINGTCSDLVLTDKANFAPAKAFTARQASYQKSGLDAGGWYSAVLPYDFNVPAGVTVLTNATVGAATINFAEATEGTVISANTPFLYKTTAGTVDFCATNTTISTDTPSSRALLGTYTLIPAGEATGKLILNADGSAFATASQKASIPAFRAYLNAQAGSKTFTISIDGELTGIADSDTLNAQSSPIDVHSIDGKLLRSQVDPLTALRGLPKGTYIVGGKKIHK